MKLSSFSHSQIHEESEDGTAPQAATGEPSKAGQTASSEPDPVDTFPSSAAGAAVIRKLEQRRRFHKSRAQSCSSSEASDDDGEGKRKRTPPIGSSLIKKDSHHDDSSDSQEPGVGASSSLAAGHKAITTTALSGRHEAKPPTGNETSDGGGNGGGGGRARTVDTTAAASVASAPPCRRHGRCASAPGSAGRIRQSHSLNRISELHVVADFSSDDNNNSSCPSSVASMANGLVPKPPPPLESDADGAPFDMLTRYLESLTVASNRNRSRDDSQNSSDGEYDVGVDASGGGGSCVAARPSASRRHKVNLRVLEQRLNKIQEENKGSADEDEEGEVDDGEDDGELSDDPSTLPDEAVNEHNRRNSVVSNRSEAAARASLIEQYDPKRFTWRLGEDDDDEGEEERMNDRASTKSCDVGGLMLRRRGSSQGKNVTTGSSSVVTSTAAKCKRPLLRAHSCGSLMSLKERALLSRNILELWKSGGSAAALEANTAEATSPAAAALGLASTPLTVLQLQTSSRCCSLC